MKILYYTLLKQYLSPLLRAEEKKLPKIINERTVEYAFVLNCIRDYCTGKILDVGTGLSSFPHLLRFSGHDVTCIDTGSSFWRGKNYFNRHYPILRDDVLNPKIKGLFQFITCISVIEHIKDSITAVKNMVNLLEPGGYLLLTFPFNEEISRINSHDTFFTRIINQEQVDVWCEIPDLISLPVKDEYWKCFTGDLWGDGERINPVRSHPHHLRCILLEKKNK